MSEKVWIFCGVSKVDDDNYNGLREREKYAEGCFVIMIDGEGW